VDSPPTLIIRSGAEHIRVKKKTPKFPQILAFSLLTKPAIRIIIYHDTLNLKSPSILVKAPAPHGKV
jgi:hypothetical protein